jgi:RNA polymerase sigma-70 factor, ECF subfamily
MASVRVDRPYSPGMREPDATSSDELGAIDEPGFQALVDPCRRELHVHCYRMLGSWQDAEDLVQETLLRAWRAREGFQGRSSVRAWLYRIATNACLDALKASTRRVSPSDLFAPASPLAPVLAAEDLPWLEPYPDRALDLMVEDGADPSAQLLARETIELAFMAAIQHLAPRQRAVLILRDVLNWTAPEVADLLHTTVASVTSLLQRARATIREQLPDRDEQSRFAVSANERQILDHYIQAWNRADVDGLVALLHEQATMTMPPTPSWYQGRDAIAAYLHHHLFSANAPDQIKLVPAAANRQPAAAAYARPDHTQPYQPLALKVLTVKQGHITWVNGFVRPDLFPAFGLPATIA